MERRVFGRLSAAFSAGVVVASMALWAHPVAAANPLKGEEIRSTVSGNTVSGTMESSGAYAEFYAADGTIKGKDYTGKWSIDGDDMCFQYGSDPQSCWQVGKDGEQVQWIKDGKVEGTGTVLPGNPNNF